MAGVQHRRLCFFICAAAFLILLFSQALRHRWQEGRHKRDILDSTEIPAEHIDPAAIDLTLLVNTLINSSQSGSRQLFSLLSVTSYSSLALHKLTLLVYNISNIRSIESNIFRRRFCYCVTNETNDLTDFTAILLDVMGNSTSYLHELFKSSSILSVSQRNNSDCIYICVMAGEMGREVPELWEVDSITPLFNQTIVEGPHRVGNISAFRFPLDWHQLPTNLSHISPSGMSSMLTSRVHSTAHVSPTAMEETVAPAATVTASQPQSTSQQPTSIVPQSQPTTGTTRTTAPQRVTTQTQAAENPTTALLPLTTSAPPAATVPVPTVEQSTAQLSTVQPRPALTPASRSPKTTTQHLTSAVHQTRPASHYPTVGLTVATRTTEPLNRRTTTPSKPMETEKPELHQTRPASHYPTVGLTVATRTTEPLSRRTTTPSKPMASEKPGCPWRRPELTDEWSPSRSTTTVSAHKLQPCVFELCKFFSQCLCKPFTYKTRMKRYCDVSHLWYEKHTIEVCRRVRRISFSRNLKQRCLTKMCDKL